MLERQTIAAASLPEFFDTVRTLALAGFVWDESGLTQLNPPWRLVAEFVRDTQDTQGDTHNEQHSFPHPG